MVLLVDHSASPRFTWLGLGDAFGHATGTGHPDASAPIFLLEVESFILFFFYTAIQLNDDMTSIF
jgi:hypothetical protein